MKPLYRYEAEVIRVVDGDTLICLVDLGFSTFSKRIVRLAKINAPEITSKDKAENKQGQVARKFLIDLLITEKLSLDFKKIYLESISVDKYGRSIATIYLSRAPAEVSINQQMIDSGNAVAYKTH